MKVALLTMFSDLDVTHSLVNIVAEHLKMLLSANIDVKMLVREDFQEACKFGIYLGERIEWCKICSILNSRPIKLHNYSRQIKSIHKTFFEETDITAKSLIENLSDVDFCMMYDIHCSGWNLVYNIAIRKVQESLPDLRFIAITASVPVKRPLKVSWPFSAIYTSMPNTTYVCLTDSAIPALAKQFDIPECKCKALYNSLDILEHLGNDIKAISSRIDLLSPDILIVYPARLTAGKKFDKVVTFASAIKKKTDNSVKIVFCDFPSADINPDLYKGLIKRLGLSLNLNNDDIVFTSELGYKNGFPRNGVLDFFTLSNLFICPSFSESFGLTALEAASRGNFLVLNEKVPALNELGKQLNSFFMRWDARNFGFDTKENYYPSEQDYLEENADKVICLLTNNPAIHAKIAVRQHYSPKWIWKNQLEPLLKS